MADQLLRATAAEGGIRAVGVVTTHLVQEARQRHGLSYVASAALGRTMTAGLLLASNMKRPEARINIRVRGNGPLGSVMVDAGRDGTVRGYVENPGVELPPNEKGKLDVGGAVGAAGYLYVVRDNGYGYPYCSTVGLVSGEIGDDLTAYLVASEQTPSALVLGVYLQAGKVHAAGGLLVQVLPKAARDEALVALLEERVASLQGFTPLLRAGRQLGEIVEGVLGDLGLEWLPETQLVRFHCGCTMDRVLGAIKILGETEIRSMLAEDNGAEVTCHFCGQVYQAGPDHLEQLLLDFQASAGQS